MRLKTSLLSICLLAAIIAVVPLLSGCNPSGPGLTPTAKPGTITTPKAPATPVIDPNAPPAAYKLTNLRADLSPEEGANAYYFYVDVENTGGQPGTFIANYRIDNGEVKNESKKLNLAPGQKKTLQLIGPQMEIIGLGQSYDQAQVDERQHVVFCGDLVLPVTLAERAPLALLHYTDSFDGQGGNITVSGDIKNISNMTFENVVAVVDIRITDQKYAWIYKKPEAPVDSLPLTPGKTASFKIVTPDDLPGNLTYEGYRITFKDAAGEAGNPIRAIAPSTQTQ